MILISKIYLRDIGFISNVICYAGCISVAFAVQEKVLKVTEPNSD